METLTANGAANSAGSGRSPDQRAAGLACVKAALLLQTFLEVGFCSLVALLHYRCRTAGHFPRNVKTVCVLLYTTSLMMLLRCIVRTVEGFEAASCDPDDPANAGYCGPVQRNEWFLWVFEVANITVFVIALAVFPPGKYLPRDYRVFLDPMDGKTERVGPGFGKADRRPMWMTVLDPFDFVGIVTERGLRVERFWEGSWPACERSLADGGRTKGVDLERT